MCIYGYIDSKHSTSKLLIIFLLFTCKIIINLFHLYICSIVDIIYRRIYLTNFFRNLQIIDKIDNFLMNGLEILYIELHKL